MTNIPGLIERLETLQAARKAFVVAREAMNAARPDPLHGTAAERALYDERYRADHEAERALFRASLDFATYAADAEAAQALRSQQAAIEKMSWQPIETAPKNRPVDLWVVWSNGNQARYAASFWNHEAESWQIGQYWLSQYVDKGVKATHWMVPPEPPALSTLNEMGEAAK